MKQIATLFLASLLSISSASADDPKVEIVELKHIPPCSSIESRDGKEFCVYSLDDFRDKLAPVDIEFQQCMELKENLESQSEKLLAQRRLLREQVQLEVGTRKLYEERTRELTSELIEKDRELQNALSRPRIGSTLAWTVAVISASVLVGYVAADSF